MNQNKTLKAILTLLVMLVTGLTVSAQENTLSIQPVSFNDHEVHKLQIDFTKVNDVVGMQFDVVLPDFLEFAGNIEKNDTRFNSNQTISFKNGRVLVAAFTAEGIQGEFGPLFYIPVKVKDTVTETETGEIKLSHCLFSGYRGVNMGGVENVSLSTSFSPYNVVFSPLNENMVINSGSSNTIGVSIDNDCPILSFQAYVTVPDGFTLASTAELSNRCPSDASLIVTHNGGNEYTLVYFCISNTALTGNSGEVFNIKVNAPEEYAAESAQILFSQVEASYAPGKYIVCNNFSFNVTNQAPLYTSLNEEIAGLRDALLAARNAINENCPDVKDNFTGDDIESAINALEEEINGMYSNGTLAEHKQTVETKISSISEQIAALEAAALEAEAQFLEDQRKSDNAAAYKLTTDALTALQTQLDAVKEEVAQKYPAANVDEAVAAAQAAIDNVAAEALAAYEAVANEGKYEYTFDSKAIEDLIAAVNTEAAGQQANYDAYQAAVGEIAQMKADLEAAKQEVAEGNPQADVEAEFAAAEQLINDAETALNNAWSETETNGTPFVSPVTDEAKQAVADAIAAAKAEAVRQQANYDAYQAALAEIEQLKADVEAAKQEIQQTYPASDVQAMFDAMDQQVAALETAAGEAYTAVAESGDFVSPVTDEAKQAVADAIAAAKAEAARQAAALAAYNQTLTEINELQTLLNQTKVNCNGLYPEADVEDEIQAAQDAIDQAKADALAAKDASMAGEEYSYVVPTNEIHALISAILTEAKRQETNKTAYDNTLAQIALLEQKLNDMVADVTANHPEVDCTEVIATAQAAIDQAKQDAADAYDDVAEEGQYSYVLNVSAIEALIEEIGRYAELNGIESIYTDQFGKDAKMYNLMGMPVRNPAPGTIVIVIDSNGQAHKLQVK